MTQEELQALIDEGKTIDEILARKGETAKELLEEKSSVIVPLDALRDTLLDEYTLPQYQSFVKTIIYFALGDYEYKPDEKIPDSKIPNSMRSNLKRFIGDNNEKYLFKHINQSIKGARGGRPKKSKALKPEDFDENPRQATETHGFQKTSTLVGETPKTEATESHGLPQKALYDNAYAKENVNENFGSSSKDNKGVGKEEKSPYFMQQSQEAAKQPQFSLATPQQSQPVEETQQPSLATPQPAAPWDNPQRVVLKVKFPVSSQPSLATPQQQETEQPQQVVEQPQQETEQPKQAAEQPQQPQQLQGKPVERTQPIRLATLPQPQQAAGEPQPSLATPQQQAAAQAKFSVGQQSQLSLSVSETIGLITQNGCDTYRKAFATIKKHGGNINVQKTVVALYFLTGKSQPEVLEITGLVDKAVNEEAEKEEVICIKVFMMATDTKVSNDFNFDDRNDCRAAIVRIKNYLKGLLTKPQSSTRPYININPNEKLPF